MFGFGAHTVKLLAPLTGAQVSLTDVPDPVFADKVLGDGIAIEPSGGECVVKAPCGGSVEVLFPTGHAAGIKITPESGYEDIEFLIHIGLNTVELKEGYFDTLVKQGDAVQAGQPLIRFDTEKIRTAGKATITPVVVTTPDSVKSIKVLPGPYIAGETPLLELTLRKKGA